MDYTAYTTQRDLGRIDKLIDGLKDDPRIINENKEAIFEMDKRVFNAGVTIGTRIVFLRWWRELARFLGETPFKEASRKQIDDLLYGLKTGKLTMTKKPHSTKTLNRFIASTIKLYKLLFDKRQRVELPECVRYLRNVKENANDIGNSIKKLSGSDMFKQDEIVKIVEMEPSIRNKALIKILFECAPRISELLSVNIGGVEFKPEDKEAVLMMRQSKTKIRPILVIDSYTELMEWFKHHPRNDDINAPLWLSQMNRPLSIGVASHILKKASKRAGFNKRISPHLLRHSGWTYKKLRGMTDDEGRQLLGWVPQSSMPSYYAHLTIENAFDKQRQLSGMEVKPKPQEEPMKKYEVCSNCDSKHPLGVRVCSKCGFTINEDERLKKMSLKQQQLNKQAEILNQYEQLRPLIDKMKELEPIIRAYMEQNGNSASVPATTCVK